MRKKKSSTTCVADPQPAENSYDLFPYPSHCFPQTHPDRLHCIARLFGMRPAETDQCRVLEIGCASGGNIIPMAEQLNKATFLGIDLSSRQISQGEQLVSAAGLKNIQLRQMDVLDVGKSIGTFDYIICHGVYSWVGEDVQRKILEICHQCLAPQGVGYISYNTYPGWHFRGLIRDMMCYHVQSFEDPQHRVTQARALLAFLAQSVSTTDSAYGMLLQSELKMLSRQSDSYLFHEHLERVNQPIYFHQFVDRLSHYALQYLGDASVSSMWIGNFPSEVAGTLQHLAPDVHQREQYTDFLRNRTFRQSLIVHDQHELNRNLVPKRFEGSFLAGQFTGVKEASVDLNPSVSVSFQETRSKRTLASTSPTFKAAVVHLSNAWPASMAIDDLFEAAKRSLNVQVIEGAEQVEQQRLEFYGQIVRLFVAGMLDVQFCPDRFAVQINERPVVSRLTRSEADKGNHVTSRRHERVAIDDLTRRVCCLADGKHTQAKILARLRELVEKGELVVNVGNQDAKGSQGEAESTPPGKTGQRQNREQVLSQALQRALQKLASRALLIG